MKDRSPQDSLPTAKKRIMDRERCQRQLEEFFLLRNKIDLLLQREPATQQIEENEIKQIKLLFDAMAEKVMECLPNACFCKEKRSKKDRIKIANMPDNLLFSWKAYFANSQDDIAKAYKKAKKGTANSSENHRVYESYRRKKFNEDLNKLIDAEPYRETAILDLRNIQNRLVQLQNNRENETVANQETNYQIISESNLNYSDPSTTINPDSFSNMADIDFSGFTPATGQSSFPGADMLDNNDFDPLSFLEEHGAVGDTNMAGPMEGLDDSLKEISPTSSTDHFNSVTSPDIEMPPMNAQSSPSGDIEKNAKPSAQRIRANRQNEGDLRRHNLRKEKKLFHIAQIENIIMMHENIKYYVGILARAMPITQLDQFRESAQRWMDVTLDFLPNALLTRNSLSTEVISKLNPELIWNWSDYFEKLEDPNSNDKVSVAFREKVKATIAKATASLEIASEKVSMVRGNYKRKMERKDLLRLDNTMAERQTVANHLAQICSALRDLTLAKGIDVGADLTLSPLPKYPSSSGPAIKRGRPKRKEVATASAAPKIQMKKHRVSEKTGAINPTNSTSSWANEAKGSVQQDYSPLQLITLGQQKGELEAQLNLLGNIFATLLVPPGLAVDIIEKRKQLEEFKNKNLTQFSLAGLQQEIAMMQDLSHRLEQAVNQYGSVRPQQQPAPPQFSAVPQLLTSYNPSQSQYSERAPLFTSSQVTAIQQEYFAPTSNLPTSYGGSNFQINWGGMSMPSAPTPQIRQLENPGNNNLHAPGSFGLFGGSSRRTNPLIQVPRPPRKK